MRALSALSSASEASSPHGWGGRASFLHHCRMLVLADTHGLGGRLKRVDGNDARCDLMLWTQVPTRQSHVEHLVIELKRPSVKIGAEEIMQIQKYGITVANDKRFDKVQTSWKFILIGKELDEYAETMCKSDDRAFGHNNSGNPSIIVTTWSALIRDARWRYDFFKKELATELSEDDGLQYLREKHSQYFADDWSVPKKAKSTRRNTTKSNT